MSCRQAHAISRRAFFRGGAASLALWSLMPRTAIAGTRDPRLLIVVLRGGLDGLATVAPVGDPDYARLRAAIALPRPVRTRGSRSTASLPSTRRCRRCTRSIRNAKR